MRAGTCEASVLVPNTRSERAFRLPRPSSAFGHVHRRHPVADPAGGFAVQIGNPADLSPDGRREKNQGFPRKSVLPSGTPASRSKAYAMLLWKYRLGCTNVSR